MNRSSEAMRETMRHVNEPIFFSGSTIVLGVATLFFALYEPYRNFAPAFAIAAIAMLIAGLTLLPALFALIGRKAFWPVIPKFGDVSRRQSIDLGKSCKQSNETASHVSGANFTCCYLSEHGM